MLLGGIVNLLVFVGCVFARRSPNGEEVLRKHPGIDRAVAEDASLDVVGLLEKYNYPYEEHKAVTEDGYILTMHRILGTAKENVTTYNLVQKPIVFLMHGILASSADWINLGPQNGLGYMLADLGFDVWMGNARGNFYSRQHTKFTPKKSAFWKFSWDEIGNFDLPAMIDKVLAVTGQSKLHYIGHSQGTTTFFVMTSRHPEYNEKIKSMHALAPVAYMSNLYSPLLKLLAPFVDAIEVITTMIGAHEFLPNTKLMAKAGEMFCKDDSFFQPVCSNILFLLCGFNPDLHNASTTPIILGHTPAGASSRQLVHYAQGINSAKYRRYDHGFLSNLKNYGSTKPPKYDLKRVTAPVFLHYADNDWLSAVEDVKQLNKELGNSVGMFRVPHNKFNHLDFLWAINVRKLLYNRIVGLIKSFD